MQSQVTINHILSVLGVNYKTVDIGIRGKFSFSDEQKLNIINQLKNKGLDAFVLSTCNRSELYIDTVISDEIIELFCREAGLSPDECKSLLVVYTGDEAKRHLMRVAAGLDSQILGDFEVAGQLKRDFQFAKEQGAVSASLERWVNTALQVSKRVKNETEISSGACSVAFASVEFLRKKGIDLKNKRVLLVGTGKIGINTCKNIIKHGSKEKITLVNRTDSTAREMADQLGVCYVPYKELRNILNNTDILIIATAASQPVITSHHLKNTGEMTIFDLSVPRNVCSSVDILEHKEVLDVDQLSQTIKENSELRKAQLPFAEAIVNEGLDEFNTWLDSRKQAALINSIKDSLNGLGNKEIKALSKTETQFNLKQAEILSERIINKIINQFASHLTSNEFSDRNSAVLKDIFRINTASE